jgi:hypothetical protein
VILAFTRARSAVRVFDGERSVTIHRRFFALGAALLALVAVVGVPAADAVTTHATTAVPHQHRAKPLFAMSGTGRDTSPWFAVPNKWALHWTFNCSEYAGGAGLFNVGIYGLYGIKYRREKLVNRVGPNGSGIQRVSGGSPTKLVNVISDCAWSVAARRT